MLYKHYCPCQAIYFGHLNNYPNENINANITPKNILTLENKYLPYKIQYIHLTYVKKTDTSDELKTALAELLDNPSKSKQLAAAGRKIIESQQGATQRYVDLIVESTPS